MSKLKRVLVLPVLMLAAIVVSCGDSVDNSRLPAYPVYLNLSGAGMWNTYGVGGVGQYRMFIKESGVPAGFPYLASSYTGFGGLLVVGVDAASNFVDQTWPYLPMAFDLSCPIECEQDVRVQVDEDKFEAECPVCHSRYTLNSGGGPVAGPAVGYKYGLETYRCTGTPMTGFTITRRK